MFRLLDKVTNKEESRERGIFVSGLIGIVINTIFSAVKIVMGAVSGSIAISADGVNNLFDASSAVIASISAKVSAKKADKEHPYGHGRFEYISALVIGLIIVLVGVELMKRSFVAIRSGERGSFGAAEIVIMTVSVVVKMWIVGYNKFVDKKYDSAVNVAVAVDAKNDVAGSLLILACLVIEMNWGHAVEPFGGLVLSGYVMFSGYGVLRDMVNKLLGTEPTSELKKEMERILRSDDRIKDVTHWHMHEYGVGEIYATVDVSMRADKTLKEAHDVIDVFEKQVQSELGVHLTIHVDPIEEGSE